MILFRQTDPGLALVAEVGLLVLLHAASELGELVGWSHELTSEGQLLAATALTAAVGVCLRAVPSLVAYAGFAVGLVAGGTLPELGLLAATCSKRG